MNRFSNPWMLARSLPFRKRLRRFPIRTIVSAVAERLLHGTVRAKTFFGEYLYVPYPKYRSIVYHGMIDGSEIPVTEYLWNSLTREDVFFDIGTNIGFYALLGSMRAQEVHAFEPFPETFEELKRNLRPNIVPNNLALLDAPGTVYMQAGTESGLNRVVSGTGIAVPAITLDAYCAEKNVWPTILKIDVEGSELKVLKGADTVLKRKPPILIEMLEHESEIRSVLQSYGYEERPFSANCKNTLFV